MKTEEKIVAKALEMFNERGVEYVGLRELASILNMRVSNITYYFPTKDDLVSRLALDLNKLNSKIVRDDDSITLFSFLDVFWQVFHNHVKYRCLLLSFVHLMKHNKIASERYKKTQKDRLETLKANIVALNKKGYLKTDPKTENIFLASLIAFITRFWISEAEISHQQLNSDQQIKHYMSLLAKFILPYSTDKGEKDIQLFLKMLG